MVKLRTAGALALVATAGALSAQVVAERSADEPYRILTFPADPDRPLEVGALLPLPGERLMVATRLGDVFMVHNAHADDPADARFVRWARGLAQPLGLVEHDGWIYTAQRSELTRMRDVDGDDRADEFETVCDAWDISGNYHEYAFGPRVDHDGQMWITLNKPFGQEPYGKAHWRGWAIKVDPATGVMTPMAAGLRSPAGVEVSPWGDVFYTDNQGEWCNASKLSLLTYGSFHGHPHGLFTRELAGPPFAAIPDPPTGAFMKDLAAGPVPQFAMPAVWFPYEKTGKSPSGMCWDRSGGRFGPFADQLFVGDQHHSMLLRVDLEEVEGHWQGACFVFREGFESGITRVSQAEDGSLFVGMTNAGWPSKGNRPWGLQRLVWDGDVPFEILHMRATPTGFAFEFTHAIERESAEVLTEYHGESYTYRLQKRYGGPEADKLPLTVTSAEVGDDGRTLRVDIDPIRAGYVHELTLAGIRSQSGAPLVHATGYYTLVKRPR